MKTVLDSLKGKLIVSCQALENEPLHSPFIMSRMALAAAQGGAVGIRANSVVDIRAIKESVSLPVIGIIKRDYPGSEVFITATLQEVDELMSVEPEIIALDATARPRPDGQTLEDLVTQIRARYPSVLLMADIASGWVLTAWAPRFMAIPRILPGMCWRKTTAVFYVRCWRRSTYRSWRKVTSIPRNAPHIAWH